MGLDFLDFAFSIEKRFQRRLNRKHLAIDQHTTVSDVVELLWRHLQGWELQEDLDLIGLYVDLHTRIMRKSAQGYYGIGFDDCGRLRLWSLGLYSTRSELPVAATRQSAGEGPAHRLLKSSHSRNHAAACTEGFLLMKLGMVTYLWGADWDLPTLIKNCAEAGFEGVELRSTHKHGVEVTLTKEQRAEVRKRFADSPVKFVGPGSACEYHSADHGVLQQNIDLTKKFVELSAEIGGTGVKVRPNGFVKGEERDKTIERIGLALRECGEFAAGHKQEIRVEVHGNGTSDPAVIQKIMAVANHPQVVVCWNSNPGETINGSIKHNFDLLKDKFGSTFHIHDLFDKSYPYRELFQLLKAQNYQGYMLSESPATTDAPRIMRYYRALFDELIK